MESLTLEQVYFIGQTISAVAVVLSLIYVGLQIKQNTTTTQAASAQAYATDINDIVGLINSSPRLADVLHEGANGLSGLKDGDIIRFMSFTDINFITYQSFYMQWKSGTLADALMATYKEAIVSLLQQKGQQEWWELRRHWFSPEFQDFVDGVVGQESSKPMHPGSAKN